MILRLDKKKIAASLCKNLKVVNKVAMHRTLMTGLWELLVKLEALPVDHTFHLQYASHFFSVHFLFMQSIMHSRYFSVFLQGFLVNSILWSDLSPGTAL